MAVSIFLSQELAAIKARVQELEMEEETERLKDEDRCDLQEMQLLTSSPRPGETAVALNRLLVSCHTDVQISTDYASENLPMMYF